ncbi:MAG: hypothetical protein KKG93_01210, partial [Bacteroidetes bacterium]|nr:hypothetical protein [Bacteroidota bacterium]
MNKLFENQDHPDPKYAFLGTVNWMRALAFIVQTEDFSESINVHYQNTSQKVRTEYEKSLVWENLLFSLHNISFLQSLIPSFSNYESVRAAIISWYYSIYYSSSSMITAVSGSAQETHTKTINVFQNQIIDNNLAVCPFHYSLSDITSQSVESQINTLRNGNTFNLNSTPNSSAKAYGCLYSYLNGTAEYQKDIIEEKVKSSKEFRDLGVDNFRTKAARALRDSSLSSHKINFLTQAFRYRGKANYRDSIYLSYGENNSATISQFIE